MHRLFGTNRPETHMRSCPDVPEPPHSVVSNTTIRFGSHCFSLPQSVTSQASFQSSKLGTALKYQKLTSLDLPDGTVIKHDAFGELHIDRPSTDDGIDHVADFGLFVEYLLGRNPLDAFGFRAVAEAYHRLVGEASFWGFSDFSIDLPYRLWTRSRWTDLAGMYSLTKPDAAFLKLYPVAIQLKDGSIQGVRVLSIVNLDTADPTAVTKVKGMLTDDKDMRLVVGVFETMDCCLVLLNSALDSTGSEAKNRSVDIDRTSPPASTVTLSSIASSPSTAASFTFPSDVTSTADQILIKLPNVAKIVAYDIPLRDAMVVPNGRDFPIFYRRGDRHVFGFNPQFSLEVQEMTDETVGSSKIRVGISRIGNVPHHGPQPSSGASSSPSTAHGAATVVMAYFKAPAATIAEKVKKVKETWQCFHPQQNAKYTPNIKWVKQLSPVRRIDFYPWGALVVSKRLESPFAAISIVHPELKKLYGDRITVYIRGFPTGVFTRQDVDVTVTANLARVYVCACNQIASASIVPQRSKIEFEIEELKEKKYRLKLVHIDVPEGAPMGHSLGYLRSVGLLSMYVPEKGLYYQNGLCRQFCSRYCGLATSHDSKDIDEAGSETSSIDGSDGFADSQY